MSPKITGYVKEQELIPAAVLLTHHHHDHVGGAAKVADILDIPVMMSFEDSLMYKGQSGFISAGWTNTRS